MVSSESNQAGTLGECFRPCYTSTASTYQWSCPRRRRLLSAHRKGLHGRTSLWGLQKECAARFPGTYSWEIRAWFRVGPGRPSALDVSRVGLFVFVARSEEIVSSATRVVHPVHCLTKRDVALYRGEQRLTSLQWHQATSIDVFVFEVIKVTKPKRGAVIMRARDSAEGRVLEWEQAAVPSLSWWSCCQVI